MPDTSYLRNHKAPKWIPCFVKLDIINDTGRQYASFAGQVHNDDIHAEWRYNNNVPKELNDITLITDYYIPNELFMFLEPGDRLCIRFPQCNVILDATMVKSFKVWNPNAPQSLPPRDTVSRSDSTSIYPTGNIIDIFNDRKSSGAYEQTYTIRTKVTPVNQAWVAIQQMRFLKAIIGKLDNVLAKL